MKEAALHLVPRGQFFNPTGIESFSPGLPDSWRATLGAKREIVNNPERVASQDFTIRMKPFQGSAEYVLSPSVARASQRWAERFNPVGIDATKEMILNFVFHSTENSEEPQNFVRSENTVKTLSLLADKYDWWSFWE